MTAMHPRQLARTAGSLYLINIVFGAFAIGVIPALLIVPDVATTAHNIQTHEMLYRLGLAAHVVVTLTNIPMALLFYELLKVVNRRVAMLFVFFTLVATAVEAAGILNDFTSVVLLGSRHYTTGLPPAQLHALAYLPGDLSTIDYSIYGVFYGFDILCIAYLVFKSTFLPRFIGVLLAIDTLGYLAGGFTDFLGPGVAANLVPWSGLPTIAGEGSLCLWLLVIGVDVKRWRQRAGEAIRMSDIQVPESV
ncbi:MAG: DUF4386 domain-containing protein [Actinobacteria bacterium]|nr:DUF4386 domain-containing protein [Actinomycetota bacterium]MBO0834398.1 DUF4386 domain-containing protein [Actinomycetota bacterium]